ncbi:hypothetical protein L1987_65904 [Smallanthus sonchifolius]|uniref:Uncharacterized protein n=1 Tax=Smallanthus sonchifolius TaxID=185202 RepID=A0ACB9BVL0_9ASTR|nr:hypothetical protein L1987_65904 [Smallanthus sonchifolius]
MLRLRFLEASYRICIADFNHEIMCIDTDFNSTLNKPVTHDDNRYNAQTGSHFTLKRAEKARALVNQLTGTKSLI